MTEHEREMTGKSTKDDERKEPPMSKGWSARWDAQALGDVRAKERAGEPPASFEQKHAA